MCCIYRELNFKQKPLGGLEHQDNIIVLAHLIQSYLLLENFLIYSDETVIDATTYLGTV